MKLTYFLQLTVLVFLSPLLKAQDTIIKRNKEQVECQIEEISEESIRYLKPDISEDVVFIIDKDKVSKVIFENGNELEFHPYLTDPENYANDKRNGLKFEFLGPIAGHAAIIYERSLKPGRSLEFSLGIAGLGQNVDNLDARGVTLKTGYKFIKSPLYYMKGQRYSHLLKGAYVRPEIQIGYFSNDRPQVYYNSFDEFNYTQGRKDVFHGAFLLNIGKQWVFDNRFVIDTYFGIGYGTDSTVDYNEVFHFGYLLDEYGSNLAYSAGLRIGILFK